MLTPIPLSDGHFTVPGNRWDLLTTMPPREASVAVVVPYYNQQRELDLVLAALDAQDHPPEMLEVVVADDGSAQPPDVAGHRLPVTVVRQPDNGFRAAAARNLGAAAASAEVLCFLDADTVPQPDYVRRISALPALCPEALVVGRRRHADFAGWVPGDLPGWFGGGAAPAEFDEPGWLREGYDRSGDLLHVDDTSYRYVISSVMCCSAAFFRELNGFDESFRHYGGEDWEFAHRAAVNGAVLHHARDAVAWHNGPDWAARKVEDRSRAKNAETLAVARLVPDRQMRVPGLAYPVPEVAVLIDAAGHGPGSLLASIAGFADLDVGIWVLGDTTPLDALALTDNRVHAGEMPQWIAQRCRVVVTVTGRAVLTRAGAEDLIQRCRQPGVGTVTTRIGQVGVTCEASWARHRRARWGAGRIVLAEPDDSRRLADGVEVDAAAVALREVDADHPC